MTNDVEHLFTYLLTVYLLWRNILFIFISFKPLSSLFSNLFIFACARLGLHCCTWAFCSCGQGLLWLQGEGFFLQWLLIAEHGLGAQAAAVVACALSGCSLQTLQSAGSVVVARKLSCPMACGIFPRPGIERVSPAFQGGFLTTGPPGKPCSFLSWDKILLLLLRFFIIITILWILDKI